MITKALRRMGWVPIGELTAVQDKLLEKSADREAPAALREMNFCQSLSSGWSCKTREICTINKRCAKPDHAYKSIEWAEPNAAREMGRTAYYAGLDITFDCPFNGSGFKQHAQAYFQLGFLESHYEHMRRSMQPHEHREMSEIRAAMREHLGLHQYKVSLSGRTLASLEQDRLDDGAEKARAKERGPSA